MVHHVWAPGLVSLEVHVASGGSPCMRSGSITGMDAVAFSRWVCMSTSLREFVLNGLQWEKVDPGGYLLEKAATGKSLRILNLSHNNLSDASIKRLANALMLSASNLRALEALVLDLNCITEAGLEALLPLGHTRCTLCTWSFRHNRLANGGCHAMARTGLQLGSWDLRTNRIGAPGCKSLALALESMVVARLGCNPLGDAGLQHLAQGLGDKLRILDLRHASFGDVGTVDLALALINASSLQELLLAGNEIGAEGALALAENWRWLCSLHHVDLSSNAIGSHGVELLSRELPYWKQSPFRLSLMGVGCGESGAVKLKSALQRHPRQEWQWAIDLQNNDPAIAAHIIDIRRLLEEAMPSEEQDELDD